MADINLIPQTEVVEQQKTEAVKKSTLFSIIFLILTVLIGAYFFVVINGIKKQITTVDGAIATLRGQIKNMAQVEISARNLNKKYKVLSTLFAQRPKFSVLLEELKVRLPQEITIDSMDVKTGTLNISGAADNYVAIASFINNLLNKSFEGGNANLKAVFTSVSLNSVNLEKATGVVKYFIVVNYDEAALRK